MKPLYWRAFFLALIVASVAVRLQAVRNRDAMLEAANMTQHLRRVVEEAGLVVLPNPAPPRTIKAAVVYFQRAGCAEASYAVPLDFNISAENVFLRLGATARNLRYHYVEDEWDRQDRTGIFLSWMRHSIRSLVTASPYMPLKIAVVVAEPPGCDAAGGPDWREAWNWRMLEPRPRGVALSLAAPGGG